jgi:aminopeptidase N
MLEIRAAEEQLRFVGLSARPIVSLLRGFSAPVKLAMERTDADLALLMAHDSDGFSRWDAAQGLMLRQLLGMIDGSRREIPQTFIAAFRRALGDRDGDQALIAEVLGLPSESYLADQMAVVDVDGIHAAREGLRRHIGEMLGADLLAVYRASQEPGRYRLDPAAIGRRAIKNRCLAYLTAAGNGTAAELCQAQFDAAKNMTDVTAALRLLVDAGGEPADRALAAFYTRWRDEPLVIDKWFGIQAMSQRPDTLDRVIRLMGHPDFTLRNPNRVRSLIGAFCAGNPVRFHAADGDGYRFLADRVLELDPVNPQIAARLLGPLVRWRRYDPDRQQLMRGEMERILAAPELSKNVYEIASKALDTAAG